MIIKKLSIDNVKKYYLKEELEEIQKMYPDLDIKNKYILFIQSELWFPYEYVSIDADIKLIHNNYESTHPFEVRTPYPNKSVFLISMKNKKRFCNLGIPIVFDTIEKLDNLKSIKIFWNIKAEADNGEIINFALDIQYDIAFEKVPGSHVYGIHTYDTPLNSYGYINDADYKKYGFDRYLEQFDSVIMVESIKDEMNFEFEIQALKGEDLNEKELNKLFFDNWGTKIIANKEKYYIYKYKSDEKLYPDIVARNLSHHG